MEILKELLFMFLGFVDAIESVLTFEIPIPLINVTISFWQILGGAFLPVLLINWFRKKII